MASLSLSTTGIPFLGQYMPTVLQKGVSDDVVHFNLKEEAIR